ncbi:hypothetical protein BDY21DRAFT_367764 [Lineolata rhizophorae]|uniref:Uncharacterized protein n=1 Tax=Lineolata rhizophorae TaxID=578093 RepID=A0A6A6NMQ2_9PEZI|nr:hypothetical protein BDY21DRAFT_367764 [Lineolata rhizophorae]
MDSTSRVLSDGVDPTKTRTYVALLKSSKMPVARRPRTTLDTGQGENLIDKNIYGKIQPWFDIVGKELDRTDILPENVYNIDEIRVKLSMLSSIKVLTTKPRENDTEIFQTPVASETLAALHSQIGQDTQLLDGSRCTLLLDGNRLLFEQNNESDCRKLVRFTRIGEAKVMSYSDIVEVQPKRDTNEVSVREGKRGSKRKSSAPAKARAKRKRKS